MNIEREANKDIVKKLSIAGLILHSLNIFLYIILLSLCLKLKKLDYYRNIWETLREMFFNDKYVILWILIGIMGFAELTLIILAAKTTNTTNRVLFFVGIFIRLCAFIGYILELTIKSSLSSNQENPQMPNNSNNTTNNPTY